MLQRRNSKQRNVIREYLCGRIDHPTAEKLYNEIKEEYPKMSLGTVYRNLMFLNEIGEIQAIEVGDGITHFDPNPQPHAHFYCKKCKQVSDIFIEDYSKITKVFAGQTNNVIDKCNVFLEGTCELCINKTDAKTAFLKIIIIRLIILLYLLFWSVNTDKQITP